MSEDYPPFYEGDRARYMGPERYGLNHGAQVEVTGCRRRSSDEWDVTVKVHTGERVSVDADNLDLVP